MYHTEQAKGIKAQNAALGNLCQALAQLRDESELQDFIKDLCTPQEIIAMADRLQIAGMLSDNGVRSYRQISASTGVSTATVTRVAHWLRNGTGGYRRVLGRLGQACAQ